MKISYRCPADGEAPVPGYILMGDGPRVRRAYRVLSARAVRPGWLRDDGAGGYTITWKLQVEAMSAQAGRDEIALGTPWWIIHWDRRKPRSRT